MKKLIVPILGCFFLLAVNTTVYSQKSNTIPKNNLNSELSNNYKELESQRLQLISEMYGMMYEVSGLFTELERSESLEQLIADAEKNQSDALTTSHKKYIAHLADIKARIITPELKNMGGDHNKNIKSMSVTEGFRRIIENKVQEILKKTDQLSGVGAKVTELNNTSYVSQNFKKQISWSFAFLVGLVIVGFFIVAYKDEKVRKSIFSGDAGLQFITIFSIIIAIILFGITEVLGGKEISALIGGISGYILGRSSLSKAKAKE